MKQRLSAILIFVLMLFTLFSLVACGDVNTGFTTCTHMDKDGDGLCDKCSERYTEDKQPETPCQHRDANDDLHCDKCGVDYTDGKDLSDPICQHRDADDNLRCDKCDESYADGKDLPDPVCQHRDADDNLRCDKCDESYADGKDLPDVICQHRDADDDSLCDKCGEDYLDGKDVAEHICTPAAAVTENEVAATCAASGSYDSVVYCSVCEKELSREARTVDKLTTHTEAAAVTENEVAATCAASGSYDSVVYCSVCEKELSREARTVDKLTTHTAAAAVTENEIAATCAASGSYDSVVYCSVCGKELSRETYTVNRLNEHTVDAWNKYTDPTEIATGKLQGDCSVCNETQYVEIPAFNTTDYVYAASLGACNEEGFATWTYTYEGTQFTYDVIVPPKSHRLEGRDPAEFDVMPYDDHGTMKFAYVYGQAGIYSLDAIPKCGQILDGYYVCDDCELYVSIQVYGPHAYGEPVVEEATCTHGTLTVRVCADCGDRDEVEADDRLAHTPEYSLVYNASTSRFSLETRCAVCTEQGTAQDVTDAVVLDEENSYDSTCMVKGNERYVYTFTAEMGGQQVQQSVYCDVELETTNNHVLMVDGIAVPRILVLEDDPATEADESVYAYSDAYIGRGLNVLDAPAQLVCGNIYSGYFLCACGTHASAKVSKVHAWGEAQTVAEASCLNGTKTVRTCTNCGYTSQTEANDRLPHSMTYTLVYLDASDKFLFHSICATCDVADTSIDVTAEVVADPENSYAATCVAPGSERYVYTFAAETNGQNVPRSVFVDVSIPMVAEHTLIVDGVRILPTLVSGVLAYSSEYIGRGLVGLENPDLETCMLINDAYFICACGTHTSVRIYNPHNYEYDADHTSNAAPTCISTGRSVYVCSKCGDVDVTDVPVTDHGYEYTMSVENTAPKTYKVVGTCSACGDAVAYNGITEDEVTEHTEEPTCAIRGTYTITLTKDLDLDGIAEVVVLVSEIPKTAHSVAEGVLVDTLFAYVNGDGVSVYHYDARYFKVLDITGFVCGAADEFNGYYHCVDCDLDYSARLVADHIFSVYVETQAPTATVPGKEVATCVCGATREREIPITG